MNTQEERWKRLLIYGLVVGFLAFFFILSTISLIKDFAFTTYVKEHYTKTTIGIIESIYTSTAGRPTQYYYQIRFKIGNKNEFQTKNYNQIGSKYKIGDTLTVRYNPKNPKESLAEDEPISYKDLFSTFLASFVTFWITLALTLHWIVLYKEARANE